MPSSVCLNTRAWAGKTVEYRIRETVSCERLRVLVEILGWCLLIALEVMQR